MSKYRYLAEEIKAQEPEITNADLGKKVKTRITVENPALTRYDLHGLPDPIGIDEEITDEIRKEADEIINNTKEKLMIQYIRKTAPKVKKVIVDVDTGAVFNKQMRGEPIGVMVAFRDEIGQMLVGWSKYNFKKDDNGDQIEQLIFTKKDAVKTAVLRALTSKISKDEMPVKIAEQWDKFLDRVERYFNEKVDNLKTVWNSYA